MSYPRKEDMPSNGLWWVVGVLAVIALLIFILPHFR